MKDKKYNLLQLKESSQWGIRISTLILSNIILQTDTKWKMTQGVLWGNITVHTYFNNTWRSSSMWSKKLARRAWYEIVFFQPLFELDLCFAFYGCACYKNFSRHDTMMAIERGIITTYTNPNISCQLILAYHISYDMFLTN